MASLSLEEDDCPPIEVDLAKDDDDEIRRKVVATCKDSLSPLFVVSNHGLGPLIEAVLRLASGEDQPGEEGNNSGEEEDGPGGADAGAAAAAAAAAVAGVGQACMSCEVAGSAAGRRLREAMRDRVVARLVDAVAGPAFRETLAAEGSTLDGRISVRCYANENDEQVEEGQARELGAAALGAHVDGNVLTVLYANGPGLQIPSRDSTITADEVAAFGMPTIGPVGRQGDDEEEEDDEDEDEEGEGEGEGEDGEEEGSRPKEEQQEPMTRRRGRRVRRRRRKKKVHLAWTDVGGFWESGGLLVNFGHGWCRRSELRAALPLRCPVLHRVRKGDAPRMSIPYLVRIVDRDSDPAEM